MSIDVDAYEDRREKLKHKIDTSPMTLSALVWALGQRLGERQSYSYVHSVLSGQKRSRPVLDKVEKQCELEGIV